MSKKLLFALSVGACSVGAVCWFPSAAFACLPSPVPCFEVTVNPDGGPDPSVNVANPVTAPFKGADTPGAPADDPASADTVAPGATFDAHGCPAWDACGWVNGTFGGNHRGWAGTVRYLGNYAQSQCQSGTWNDCISSIDDNGRNTKCALWFKDKAWKGDAWVNWTNRANGSLGGFNDTFSSLNWC